MKHTTQQDSQYQYVERNCHIEYCRHIWKWYSIGDAGGGGGGGKQGVGGGVSIVWSVQVKCRQTVLFASLLLRISTLRFEDKLKYINVTKKEIIHSGRSFWRMSIYPTKLILNTSHIDTEFTNFFCFPWASIDRVQMWSCCSVCDMHFWTSTCEFVYFVIQLCFSTCCCCPLLKKSTGWHYPDVVWKEGKKKRKNGGSGGSEWAVGWERRPKNQHHRIHWDKACVEFPFTSKWCVEYSS